MGRSFIPDLPFFIIKKILPPRQFKHSFYPILQQLSAVHKIVLFPETACFALRKRAKIK
jgi:hypothetical protein